MTAAPFAYLDHPGPLAIAHRGASHLHPENSMAAFEAAVQLGYRYLETDVRLTRDKKLVVFHDSHLDRMTGMKGAIADLNWADIRNARLYDREPIPLLSDLLEQWPHTRFNIDPKSDEAVAPLVALLKRMEAADRVCIGAFSGARLATVRAAFEGNICTSMGPREIAALRIASLLPLPGRPQTWRVPAPCVQVPLRYRNIPVIDRAFVRAAHKRGLKVHAWTINAEAEMRRLLALGVDGIMTDDAALLKSVFQAHNLWFETANSTNMTGQ